MIQQQNTINYSQDIYNSNMGRKRIQKTAKQTKNKEELSVSQEVEVKDNQKKATRGKKGKVEDASLFSDSFNNRIEQFKEFYTDFLVYKGSSGQDEFSRVIQQVSSDLEKACAEVLKKDIGDAQKWIENQTVNVKQQIQSTSDAESNTRAALDKAGTFTLSQIEAQINVIRQKGKNLHKTLAGFQSLRDRAQEIYKQSGIDEQ